ncbi:hypothetical protein ECG_09491 [Echinococcus granulosus]|uniref:Uncharacterized protein n=1 Tax=Echinococcus granulosus TaxID=6210 RepID=W6UVQ9_ECHGR|nr:hypothetical protein EGR_07610 [Echinococcus granulosus]EUB57519.1 hypothetical protein EGR_07610 [Echinococcus granulosus]KAH9277659.1 hypothetical protein ECG_09491 [Echinococcus granulosus]
MPEHHLTCIPHQPYSAARHADLLIDLYYLDPDTPMMIFTSDYSCLASGKGCKIPVFIGGPLMLLRRRQGEEIANSTDSFISRISGRPALHPTPEICQCEVCQEVKWLLKDCRCYDDCQARWCSRDSVFLFEILKEVLSRLKQKLVPYSLMHYEFVKISQFFIPQAACPPGTDDEASFKPNEEFEVFLKMQSFLILRDLQNQDIYTDVLCCVMTNLQRMLRAYVNGELKCAEGKQEDSDYIFRALGKFPTEVSRAMTGLSAALSPRIIDLKKHYYVPCEFMTFVSARDELDSYLWAAMNCMRSLLVANLIEPFDRSAEYKVRQAIMSDEAVKEYVETVNKV